MLSFLNDEQSEENYLMKLIASIVFLFSHYASARFDVPPATSEKDQKTIFSVLGFGIATRELSDPVPLGGKQGFDLSLQTEWIPISDLQSEQKALQFFQINSVSMGKGLPYKVDVLMSWSLFNAEDEFSRYAGQIRWGFYEFENFPGILSMSVSGSGARFGENLDVRTIGWNLLSIVQVHKTSLFFGGGQVRSFGQMQSNLSYTGTTQFSTLDSWRTLFGTNFRIGDFFVLLQVDRVSQFQYSTSVGYRF